MKQKAKTKKIITAVLITLAVLILAALVLYINLKSFTVKKVSMPDGQEIYLMGTFHTEHFEKYANYSIDELLNAVDNIAPDAVFIEAREASFTDYGVVDGPIDMCVAYCRCMDNEIPVELIDYWTIDNEFKENSTNDDRDDRIHENIMEKLKLHENEKVLVICGFGHLSAQTERLLEAGGKTQRVPHVSSLFHGETENFTYPNNVCEVWENRVLFYGHTVPRLVQADDTLNDETKAKWAEDENNDFYNWQMEYCELFRNNELYMD